MKGIVLAHEVISAQDGHRYSFTQEDVKSQDKIQIGDEVDFVANNLKANEIYVISKILNTRDKQHKNTSTCRSVLIYFGFIGGVLYIPGFICLLIAILKLANLVNSPTLKRNYILSAICGVIGVVLILISAFLGMSSSIGATNSNGGFTFSPIVIILLVLGVIISIYSLYKIFLTYKELSQISGDKFFLYYAIFFIIGIATMMVLVGYILLIVATILHIIAWYRFKIAK